MLDPPEDDEEMSYVDYDEEQAIEIYDIDEESANASSRWQNNRNL